MPQPWKPGPQIGPHLFRRSLRSGHGTCQELYELLQAGVNELSPCITPLAVVLIKGAVWLPAENAIVLQGHTAALADKPSGRAQKRIDGNVIQGGKALEGFRPGKGLPRFP